MVKLNVLQLLKNKKKTKYWLFNQLNMSYQNFNNMIMNKTKSIRYEMISVLCEILECSPNELFVISDNK